MYYIGNIGAGDILQIVSGGAAIAAQTHHCAMRSLGDPSYVGDEVHGMPLPAGLG